MKGVERKIAYGTPGEICTTWTYEVIGTKMNLLYVEITHPKGQLEVKRKK